MLLKKPTMHRTPCIRLSKRVHVARSFSSMRAARSRSGACDATLSPCTRSAARSSACVQVQSGFDQSKCRSIRGQRYFMQSRPYSIAAHHQTLAERAQLHKKREQLHKHVWFVGTMFPFQPR